MRTHATIHTAPHRTQIDLACPRPGGPGRHLIKTIILLCRGTCADVRKIRSMRRRRRCPVIPHTHTLKSCITLPTQTITQNTCVCVHTRISKPRHLICATFSLIYYSTAWIVSKYIPLINYSLTTATPSRKVCAHTVFCKMSPPQFSAPMTCPCQKTPCHTETRAHFGHTSVDSLQNAHTHTHIVYACI